MTLFKQIALLVSLAFFLLASIIVINDFNRSSEFLQGQLQTTAKDMTTTLGIAISNLPVADDKASLEVLFNAVFDSGYYSNISLVSPNGEIIQQKTQEIIIESIPQWFLQMVPLSSAEGRTQVMQGWSQLGELRLTLHPGFAYSGLYTTLISTMKWFGLLLVGAIMILWLILHYLLLPLQRVKEQADAIHRNQFFQQEKLPATKDLRSVVEAMNRMVAKVQDIFNDQEKTLSRYQELLYRDKLTGIGNRRYLLENLDRSLAEDSPFHGCLGIIKVVNFDLIRENRGYQVSDQLAQRMADLIVMSYSNIRAQNTARLSDDEFAFLVSADDATSFEFVNSFFQQFKLSLEGSDIRDELFMVAAISTLSASQSTGELLSNIDYCLTQAVNEGPYAIEKVTSSNLTLPQGKIQWRTWLEDVIRSNRLFLVGQTALDRNENKLQKELFVRAKNSQNEVIPASAFMPMATSLGMVQEIDKIVFKLVRETIDLDPDLPLAINLSVAFFELAEAHEEFEQLLVYCRDNQGQLCIEASHHVLIQHPEMCSQISDRVRKFGHQFGIDNLDLGQPLQLLQSARFDYVKINAKTLQDMNVADLSTPYQALRTMTDTLDIKIIAVGVDSQILLDELQAMGIEFMQGNFLDEPAPV
ncbi:MAG: EAL domain-containing protein (putative c-di-GMP-specific phosphodiesterase class I) [Gammaproteobacteria bacterium]|jgi:EAL domain-containing protein (putative c-di-GMP-specific phosphodiesterase class I)/GGDEF domain-containing protein